MHTTRSGIKAFGIVKRQHARQKVLNKGICYLITIWAKTTNGYNENRPSVDRQLNNSFGIHELFEKTGNLILNIYIY